MNTAPTLKPEDRISHYRVAGPLGVGGMGEVYRAKDESLERDVALKILPPALVRSEERLRRFVLEAKSASSLNHPNIITIYEIGQAEIDSVPLHFISMELVTGETLTTKIHGENTNLETLLGWLAQAAEGLAKAHAAGIVHRDLKPGNIMVSNDGYAKVLDFGLAKLTERQVADGDKSAAATETEGLTSGGVVLGTIGYMSPEQVQGKPVDHRADIFSFGCILYEAATRRRPFAGDSVVEIMHNILKDKPAPIEELNAEAPAELRRLIRRCLAKDPNQRLDSMKALAIELREIVDEYDALSASASSGSGTRPIAAARRSVAIVPLVAVVGLLAVAAVLAGIWFMHRDDGKKTNAAFPSTKITALPGRGDVSSAALSPDGRYLASVSGPPEGRSIWVRQVSAGRDVEVFQASTPPGMLTFAPDGEHLFFAIPDPENPAQKALYEIPVLGGTPVKRASHVDWGVTFAPDGIRVCFARARPDKKQTELVIADLKTGEERVVTTIEEPTVLVSGPAWSPDGETIAAGEVVSSGGLTFPLVVFRASDGRREVVPTDSSFAIKNLIWLPDGSGLVIAALSLPALRAELWLLPYPGGTARRITNDTDDYSSLSISSDGSSLVAIRSSSVFNLWRVEARAGADARQLTSATASENALFRYRISRNGSVVFMSNDPARRLWKIGTDGAAPAPLTTEGTLSAFFFPLPDGGVVCTRFGEGSVPHIWRLDPNGPPRQLTAAEGEVAGAVSPDGQILLFWPAGGGEGLWAVPVKGGAPTRLVASFSPSSGAFPEYSPEGNHIAYGELSEVDGKSQRLWKVIRSTGGDPIAVLSPGASAHDVEWTVDGKALTFLDETNGVTNVFRQSLDGGQPKAVTHFTGSELLDH